MFYVGWDWASEAHDVTVIDVEAVIVDRWAMAHDAEGIDSVLARLARLGAPKQMLVGIEARKGLVVDRLMAGGFGVVPIHPSSFNAARPRWGASRSKSDPGDSYKLADCVRTDSHCLAQMGQLDRSTADLQALCRVRDDHVEAKVAAMNQLDATLATHWPGAGRVFFRFDSNVALSFLERYPTAESASKVGVGRMRQFCEGVGYSGGKTAEELVDRLRSAPTLASRLSPEIVKVMVLTQISLLRLMWSQSNSWRPK